MTLVAQNKEFAGSESREKLTAVVEAALAEVKQLGASSAKAAIGLSQGLSVTVRLGEVETVERTRDKALDITVYFGKRTGSASTTDFSPAAVRDTARAACTIARYTAEDEAAGLPDADRLAKKIPDLDLYHPWNPEPEEAIEMARICEDSARAVDARIVNSEGANFSAGQGFEILGNSLGFVGSVATTRFSLSASVVAETDSGMQRDYWWTSARSRAGLETPENVGREAGRRTAMRLDARKLSTRRCRVLYEAPIASSLLSHLISAINGRALYREASFLQGHLGQKIFAPFVRLHEQPHLKTALGSAAFDDEGVATSARDLVRDGVLLGYVLDSYSARKLKMQTTGNAGGVFNLTLDPGALDFKGMLRELGSGLLVAELIGFGVNTVTGDYSRGAAGFWVEGGEIQYPVEEITIAGNLKEMFQSIVVVGDDVDVRGSVRTGSIMLDGMTVAGS